ncbi:MAG TPA: DUF222 domain-containing protein [Acidimicrobiales bacterium]|jgi:hypothetical protein|nr:DUF222 domain-containing protein [Acidimicrobiales bacterium]
MAQDTTPPASALGAGGVAGLSNEEFRAELDELFRERAAVDGRILERLGEVARREAFRDEGATSTGAWVAERFGVSTTTARALAQVGEKARECPHLVGALCEGDITFDKVRAVSDVATAKTDRDLCDQAKKCSVRQLAEVARMTARSVPPSTSASRSERDRRYLRFNDEWRTMSVQLPDESYAETKTCLEARAKAVRAEESTAWDQRLCDAFSEVIASSFPGASSRATTGSPYVVVAHVPLDALVEESGEPNHLVAELESGGLIDVQTVRRLACDATIVIGVDDDVGHTMYEGRARRFPSDAQRREVTRRDRACRFPGCSAATFTNVHHIVAWKAGGRTDLDTLALMCRHHHGVVHRKGWSMTGNANDELTIVGPSGRVMVSRPDPRWTRVTRPEAMRAAGEGDQTN